MGIAANIAQGCAFLATFASNFLGLRFWAYGACRAMGSERRGA